MKTFLTLLLTLTIAASFAQDNSPYIKKLFVRGADTLPYRVLYPLNHNPKKKYPLVLFLHGAGERGTNNESQLIHGASLFADSANRKRFPAIVIFPQCPYTDYWARMKLVKEMTDSTPHQIEYPADGPPNKSLDMVSQLIDVLAASGSVDSRRIYVGGLSMGGMGTFELLWRKPRFFAAAFPICGGGNVNRAADYGKNFPIWVFHGEADQVVDVNDSRKMVKALKEAGAKLKYSEYPKVKHDSWTNTFAEPGLLPWLFSQKRK
ncbi:MAG TPA: dienelactone hydrolase family protein [Chitinophagaceae bacterium]